MKRSPALAAAFGLALCGAALAHGDGHDGHNAQDFAFGKPGDPHKSAREVDVVMREEDGKMLFSPQRVEIRQGEQIRFVLKNAGTLDHEFVLGTRDANLAHEAVMAENHEMAHDEPNEANLQPGATRDLVWKFTRSGEFDFSCLIPGHREAGMTGVVVVQ